MTALRMDNLHIKGTMALRDLRTIWPLVSATPYKHLHKDVTRYYAHCPLCNGLRGASPVAIRVVGERVDVRAPAGLAPYFGTVTTLQDTRIRPPLQPVKIQPLSRLRSYQRVCLERLILKGRGLLIAPTGSGKTLVLLELARYIGSAVILAPTREIVQTILKDARQHYADYPIAKAPDDGPIIVSTYAHFVRNGLPKRTALIVDEAHHAGARDLYRALQKYDCYYRYGCTATPTREDHRWPWVVGALGPVAAAVDEASIRKYLAEPHVFMHIIWPSRAVSTTHIALLEEEVVTQPEVLDYVASIIHRSKEGLFRDLGCRRDSQEC